MKLDSRWRCQSAKRHCYLLKVRFDNLECPGKKTTTELIPMEENYSDQLSQEELHMFCKKNPRGNYFMLKML